MIVQPIGLFDVGLQLWSSGQGRNVAETQEIESLILAQNERWRRASDMQVERESLRMSKVAHG